MQRHFDQEIQELRQRLVHMGGIAESMIALALRSIPEPVCPHPEFANETELRAKLRDRARRLPRNPFSALRTIWRGRKLPERAG